MPGAAKVSRLVHNGQQVQHLAVSIIIILPCRDVAKQVVPRDILGVLVKNLAIYDDAIQCNEKN